MFHVTIRAHPQRDVREHLMSLMLNLVKRPSPEQAEVLVQRYVVQCRVCAYAYHLSGFGLSGSVDAGCIPGSHPPRVTLPSVVPCCGYTLSVTAADTLPAR